MTNHWKTRIAAIVLAGAASSVAIADGYEPTGKGFAPPAARKWTGWHVGVHGGGTDTNYSTSLNDGRDICWTQAEGTGNHAAAAACATSPTQAAVATAAFTPAAAASTSEAIAADIGAGVGALSDTTNVAGGAIAIAVAADVDPDTAATGLIIDLDNPPFNSDGSALAVANEDPAIFAAAAHSSVSGPLGSADAVAVALVNAIDLGTGGSVDNNSASVGGHVGYDHQLSNNIVIGFEADLTSLVDGDTTSVSSDSFDFFGVATTTVSRSIGLDTKYIGTARARLGYAMGHVLPYVTGGVAFAKFDVDTTTAIEHVIAVDGSFTRTFSESETRRFDQDAWGGVVGGGVSWMFGENVVLSGEGLYYIFDETVNIGPPPAFIFGNPRQRVELDDIVEGRVKLSIMLN